MAFSFELKLAISSELYGAISAGPEHSGLFKTIRIGNMIRISRKSFEDWLKSEGLDDEIE